MEKIKEAGKNLMGVFYCLIVETIIWFYHFIYLKSLQKQSLNSIDQNIDSTQNYLKQIELFTNITFVLSVTVGLLILYFIYKAANALVNSDEDGKIHQQQVKSEKFKYIEAEMDFVKETKDYLWAVVIIIIIFIFFILVTNYNN